jgi:hypothetical protein
MSIINTIELIGAHKMPLMLEGTTHQWLNNLPKNINS